MLGRLGDWLFCAPPPFPSSAPNTSCPSFLACLVKYCLPPCPPRAAPRACCPSFLAFWTPCPPTSAPACWNTGQRGRRCTTSWGSHPSHGGGLTHLAICALLPTPHAPSPVPPVLYDLLGLTPSQALCPTPPNPYVLRPPPAPPARPALLAQHVLPCWASLPDNIKTRLLTHIQVGSRHTHTHHAHTRAHVQSHTHTHAHTHAHAHVNARMHARTHSHVHTRASKSFPPSSLLLCPPSPPPSV